MEIKVYISSKVHKFCCFIDATFANLKRGASQGGCIIFLCADKKFTLVSWKSKKLKRVAKKHSKLKSLP